MQIQGALVAESGNFYIVSKKYLGEIRVQDQAIKYALPDSIRAQFLEAPGVLGTLTHTMSKNVIDSSGGTYGVTAIPYDGTGITFTTEKYRGFSESLEVCDIYEGGTKVDASSNPFYGDFSSGAFSYDQRSVGGTNYFAGHGNSLTSTFTPMTSKPMWIKIDLLSQDYSFNG